MRNMDARKEIAELRKMITDYIAYLKEFTFKTIDILRTIDRRLAALEARLGSLELPAAPEAPAPKPETIVKPAPKPEIPPRTERPAPRPIARRPIEKPPIERPASIAPVMPTKKRVRKKPEEEVPSESIAEIAESLGEILDV